MDVLLASKLLVILISLTLRTFIVCFLLTSFISLCKNKPFVFIFILLNILNYRLMIHESTQSYSHLSAWYIVFLSVEFGSLKCSDEPVLWQIAHGRSVYDIRHKAHLSDVEKNRSVNMYARRCQCSLIPGSHRGFTDCSLSRFLVFHVSCSSFIPFFPSFYPHLDSFVLHPTLQEAKRDEYPFTLLLSVLSLNTPH